MRTGALMEFHLIGLVKWVLSVLLLLNPGGAAPGQIVEPMENRLPPEAQLNPFGSGEEEQRLLQSYIQSILKNDQGGPEISSWEQEVFFLFRLYDFDRSGFLDGLEMMKLLSDYSKHSGQMDASELIVPTVDFLLQTQDLNHDGLLGPSELMSPSLTHTQGSQVNQRPQTRQEVVVENRPSATEEENAEAVENKQQEDAHEGFHPQEEEIQNQETRTDNAIQQIDEHNQQQIEDALAEEHEEVPVHQGQPEI